MITMRTGDPTNWQRTFSNVAGHRAIIGPVGVCATFLIRQDVEEFRSAKTEPPDHWFGGACSQSSVSRDWT
jgi:hypothetical protein